MGYIKLETGKSKLRLFLSTAENEHRRFYWFQMKDKDCYWGNSAPRKHSFCELTEARNGRFTIQTPESFKTSIDRVTKYSYHESGQFHVKQNLNGVFTKATNVEKWDSEQDSKLLFTVLSQPVNSYPVDNKNKTRDNAFGRAILLEGEASNRRLFSEFYLTRVESKTQAVNLLPFPLVIDEKFIHHQFCPLNSDYFILMRYIMFSDLYDWHPDKELIFL